MKFFLKGIHLTNSSLAKTSLLLTKHSREKVYFFVFATFLSFSPKSALVAYTSFILVAFILVLRRIGRREITERDAKVERRR